MADPVVLSLGGSVLGEDLPDSKAVKGIVDGAGDAFWGGEVYIVVGGGGVARHFISQARDLDADEGLLDEIGIAATRLNARLLIAALRDVSGPGKRICPSVPGDFDTALNAQGNFNVVVMGGTHPGHTTDGVAAMLAERARARLVIATDVDGVYDRDPADGGDAERFDSLDHDQLWEIAVGQSAEAGSSGPIDPLAARIIVRSKLEVAVVDGRDPEALKGALAGGDFDGTRIG